jgi:hypothetical protein
MFDFLLDNNIPPVDPLTGIENPESGDIFFPLQLVEGISQVRQELSSRLRFVRGEYYLDTSIGVPYYDGMLEKGSARVILESEIKRTIFETPQVVSLVSFETVFNSSTRSYAVIFQAQTSEGLIEQSVIL